MTYTLAKPPVLVVDDNPANRMALRALLEPLYSVVAAAAGSEALDLTVKQNFAVILLDVRMPGMDGYAVAELLRKRERTRYTPIVFISACDKTELHAKRGYHAGATDYLFSPIDEDLLKYKVATYVQIALRNEALWQQVHLLQETVQTLEEELAKLGPNEPVQRKMRRLESQLHSLKGRLDPSPL